MTGPLSPPGWRRSVTRSSRGSVRTPVTRYDRSGDRLDEPLRVAIAGRLKAGKSTLVNALIGRRVAPTAAGECTRVVTRFRYGPADRVDVVLPRRVPAQPAAGRRRDDPAAARGAARAGSAYVDVTLTSEKLRDLTVVDTPGLASTDTGGQRPRRAMAVGTSTAPFDADIDDDSAAEVAAAEAVVYVFTQAVRADDVQALEAFRAASARLASSPINALGVFGKVDTLVGGAGDPWPVAGSAGRAAGGAAGAYGRPRWCRWWGCSPRPARRAGSPRADCAALRQLARLPATELRCCWPRWTCSAAGPRRCRARAPRTAAGPARPVRHRFRAGAARRRPAAGHR